MGNPLIDDYKRLQRLPVPDVNMAAMPAAAPPPSPPVGPNPLTGVVSPALSVLKQPNQAAQNTQDNLLLHQNELKRLDSSGSGISQIQNKGLRTAARIGDTALRILLPGAEALTPGTEGNHQRLQGVERARIGQDIGNEQNLAQVGQTEANTNYLNQRPDIEEAKIEQKHQMSLDRLAGVAAARGLKMTTGPDGIPTFEDDHESQAFKDHQALSAMHQATADKSAIMADIQKNHYIPGTPEWTEAQRKLQQVDQKLQVAMGSLGLRAKGLQLRQNNQNADFYGTGPDGSPLPGTPQITDDQGNVTNLGRRNANTAIRQQGKVVTFNDLSGSVTHLRDAIKAYEATGGDLSDATLAAAAADPNSTVGKIIQGKLVTGGLSKEAINLLNAQRQTMEQAGILRSTTGGTSSEAGAQRILEVVPKFGSDTNASAYNKLNQQEEVLRRLAPGQVGVTGGAGVKHRGGAGGGQTYKQTASGQGGHKIGSNDGGNTWFDVQTGKEVK
jgi:hypothetical protein